MPNPSLSTAPTCPCFGCGSGRRLRARDEPSLVATLRRTLKFACSTLENVPATYGYRARSSGAGARQSSRSLDVKPMGMI